mgnify:CR=1 FL=1
MEAVAPFGAYPTPRWLRRASDMSASGETRLWRYLCRKFMVRIIKNWARPFDVEVDGVKLRLYPTDNLHDRMTFVHRELPAAKWCGRLFPPHDGEFFFVDIGANVGVFTLRAIAHYGDLARILAIEPHPVMRERLRANVALNHSAVRIESVAVGDRCGDMILSQPSDSNFGLTSLHPDAGGDRARAAYTVTVDTLVAILARNGVRRIDLLKIDIEGYEDRALVPFFKSAPRSLWPRRIFIEHDQAARWEVDVMNTLCDCGYVIVDRDQSDALLSLADATDA